LVSARALLRRSALWPGLRTWTPLDIGTAVILRQDTSGGHRASACSCYANDRITMLVTARRTTSDRVTKSWG